MAALLLAACSPSTNIDQPNKVLPTDLRSSQLYSAQAIGPVTGGIQAIALVPNATIPWEGRVLAAPKTGGLQIFSVEGGAGASQETGTYNSLAVHPGFAIRDLKTALIFAVTQEGKLETKIVDDARGQIFDVPVSGLNTENISAVCALPSNKEAGIASFGVAHNNQTFELVDILDTGNDQLQAQTRKSAKLATTLSTCAGMLDRVYGTDDSGSIYKIDTQNNPVIENGILDGSVDLVVVNKGENDGYILSTGAETGTLVRRSFDLTALETISIVKSLSIDAVTKPKKLSLALSSFGGTSFSSGLLAVTDDSSNMVALIVHETLPDMSRDHEDR